jgi:hypothetical protein
MTENEMTGNENELELEPMTGSELPLVTRDDTPPLLLDLPDGQQLVVGKLPDGIVIEIATWRGTGRPDSRTNRMMLGVSYDDDVVAEEKVKKPLFKSKKKPVEEQPPLSTSHVTIIEPTAPTPVVELPETPVQPETPSEVLAAETVVTQEYVAPAPIVEPEVSTTNPPIVIEVSTELEEIVAEDDAHPHVVVIEHKEEQSVPVATGTRNMQDLFGARPRTQVTFEGEGSKLDSKAHEIVKKEKAMRNSKIDARKIARWLAYPVVTALVVFLFVGPGKFSVTHPAMGVTTSLSSAENALVIVRAADSYVVGDNVVANIEADGSPTVFGSIAATSDTEYVLTENNIYHSALKSEVKGKVVLVMPGLGYLAGLIGF